MGELVMVAVAAVVVEAVLAVAAAAAVKVVPMPRGVMDRLALIWAGWRGRV